MKKIDAIVIGSGYGGAVSALRLAEAGLNVAVLETGYEHKAPNIPRGEASEWNPQEGRFGPHTVQHLSETVTAWRGTAVGGGSIVNAAVMIRKDDFECWPGGITRSALDPYYDLAELMLGAATYPLDQGLSTRESRHYAATTKSHVMLRAASKLGVVSVMPPVAITYRQEGEAVGTIKLNQYGAAQQGCRQCGECSLPGCNYQAKNSLDFNYLFAAQHRHGATILQGHKVDKIEPIQKTAEGAAGGYRVTAIDPRSGAVMTYEAKIVVVAAGAIGSSELLLRNKLVHKSLNLLSDRLGQQYTTNGTFIGFAIRSKSDLDPSGGPEITAGLDFKGPDGKGQGMLMFDGSFRGFSYDTFYITGLLARLPKWAIKLASAGFNLAEKIGFVEPRTSLPLLVIGRDNAVGQFFLDAEGKLTTDLNPRDNASFYKRANDQLRAFTRAMGTKFLPFPQWSLRKKIDVPHNLGGVPMGESWHTGVVDDKGRVYNYDNLLVLDGSIIPVTMGANPALTIAALAERSMEAVIAQYKSEGKIHAQSLEPTTGSGQQRIPPAADYVTDIVDLSEEFEKVHARVRLARISPALRISSDDTAYECVANSPAWPQWNGQTVLWTQGLFARHVSNHSEQALQRLFHLGYKVVKMKINTDVATPENIELIKERICQLPVGKGILVGHSRGGNMNLDAYRQLSRADKDKVARIILVQAPVNGSPVADYAIAGNARRRLISLVSRVVFGNDIEGTLVELSTNGRAVAQRHLPPLTTEDIAKIVTMRSLIGAKESASFELARRINRAAGQASDGLTPYAQSAIPGARDVTLRGFDHEMLVIQKPSLLKRVSGYKPSGVYEAGDVIETLLRIT